MTLHKTSYHALASASLSPVVARSIKSFWVAYLKTQGLEYEVDTDGYFSDVETLGEDFIKENLMHAGSVEGDEEYTMQELMDSREAEGDLIQFDINQKNVEKLIAGPAGYGLLKTPLTQRIEMIYVPKSDTPIIRGGRHRLVALATIMKGVRGWEYMSVPVTIYRGTSLEDVAQQIGLSNTSRAMSQTEKTQLKFAAKGAKITVYSDPSDIFESTAKNAKTVTDLKSAVKLAFVSLLSDEQVVKEAKITTNTLGDLGSSFINKFTSSLKGLQPGADKVLLASTGNGQLFEALVRSACKLILANWSAYTQEISEQVTDKKSGEITTSVNYARHAPKVWGSIASEVLVEQTSAKLLVLFNEEQAKAKVGKQAKVAESQAGKLAKEMKALDDSLLMFKSGNIPIPAELQDSIDRKKAELQQKIDGLNQVAAAPAAPIVPAAPTAPTDDIDNLLA